MTFRAKFSVGGPLGLLFIVLILTLQGWFLATQAGRLAAQGKKAEAKAEMAARGERYEPGAFPNDWAARQRVVSPDYCTALP